MGSIELHARRKATTKMLAGLSFEDELEVSDGLIAHFVHMAEGDKLRYVSWEQCPRERWSS